MAKNIVKVNVPGGGMGRGRSGGLVLVLGGLISFTAVDEAAGRLGWTDTKRFMAITDMHVA